VLAHGCVTRRSAWRAHSRTLVTSTASASECPPSHRAHANASSRVCSCPGFGTDPSVGNYGRGARARMATTRTSALPRNLPHSRRREAFLFPETVRARCAQPAFVSVESDRMGLIFVEERLSFSAMP
jgi:hypothetical protein